MFEVELKFPVDSLESLRGCLLGMGAIAQLRSEQSDEYLNDPLRDFATTDQALRIRSSNGINYLTYKGPNLDPQAKIRLELEMPLASKQAADVLKAVFLQMNFVSVANVVKHRETLTLHWHDEQVEVCLDEVDELGGFCELEIVVDDESAREKAKQKLLALAEALGLENPIRTSYLELLLDKRGQV